MKFIDHTGHLFELKSYAIDPIGYEYEETKYVFWFENEQGYKFSVDTYAIKPIRIVFDEPIYSIDITLNSQKFSLISSSIVEQQIDKQLSDDNSYYNVIFDENLDSNKTNGVFVSNLFGYTQLYYDDFVEHLHDNEQIEKNQLSIIENLKAYNDNQKTYTLVPFYVAVKSKEAGTWQSNVLVHVTYAGGEEEWCPFTIAAEIVDECEELIINGQNMGVYLPKEILNAVYQCGYNNNNPDERLYAQKLKEYLMNFMDIKGQTGNYKSALNALKWFGWGDKLEIYKLLKTDNEFQAQYIRDDFDLINDTIYSYRYFKNEALLAISLEINSISEESKGFDFQERRKKENNEWETDQEYEEHRYDFWGEDKPIVGDLFKENVIVHYDEGDLDFYKPYFDYEFNELGLKLCMLKYYYEKYFLPLHLAVNSLSLMQRVFMNDIKYVSNCSPKITAEPVFMMDSAINVKFPLEKQLFLTAQYHEVDDNFIEFGFNNFDSNMDAKWKMYETCASVPITFTSTKDEQYYDTIIKLYKDDIEIYSRQMQFNLSDLIKNENKFTYKQIFLSTEPDITQQYYSFINGKYVALSINDVEVGNDYYIRKYEHYLNFVIHPKTFNRYIGYDYVENGTVEKNKKMALNLWLDSKYKITVWANSNNYEYNFTLRLPDMGLRMGKLVYKYTEEFRQLYYENNKLNFLSFMWNPDLVTVNNIDYIDDLYFFQDAMTEYVDKYYKTVPNIVNEKKYLNKCHLYKLLENGSEKQYEGFNFANTFHLQFDNGEESFVCTNSVTDLTNSNLALYQQFFVSPTENKNIVQYNNAISSEIENNEKINYDFYLMHDNTNWYVVLISKETIGDSTENDLKAPELPAIGNYTFEYELSDEKFLVNRFVLDETGGVNKFKATDIIVMYLESNYKLPYKIGLSTKWLVKPMSIGMSNECKIESPSEIAIISVGDKNFKYEKGYYSVVCRYSLDDFYQESIEKKGIFMVE